MNRRMVRSGSDQHLPRVEYDDFSKLADCFLASGKFGIVAIIRLILIFSQVTRYLRGNHVLFSNQVFALVPPCLIITVNAVLAVHRLHVTHL